MRKIAILLTSMMPAFCMAYYDDEPRISGWDVFVGVLFFLFFILTVVALFKIISISGDVRKMSKRNVQGVYPSYYYLMGDKEKAKEILTQQMVASLEEMLHYTDEIYIDQKYWQEQFAKIECEIPEPLASIKKLDDYRDLFNHKPKE